MPNGEELNKVLAIYQRLGFPGCIGSIDCTHVPGGYERLSIYVNPNVIRSDRSSIVWSLFLEAIRKDVECTFGILKNQ